MASYKRPAEVWLPPELDNKAKEVHARMAVYIDNFIYKPKSERDDAKIYEYLYHITYMLACKAKMFQKGSDYDEFSLYAASKVYGRLINERQFIEEPGKKKLEKITSILNYIKNSLYGMKVSFQKEAFNQVFDNELGFDGNNLVESWKDNIREDYREGLYETIIESISDTPYIAKNIVKSTPYAFDPLMSRRLYISCILSFLNSIELPNKIKQKIAKKEMNNIDIDSLRLNYIEQQSDNFVILWRLNPIFTDYVDILVKRIKQNLVERITGDINYFEVPDDVLNQIIRSPLSEYTNKLLEE